MPVSLTVYDGTDTVGGVPGPPLPRRFSPAGAWRRRAVSAVLLHV